MHMGEIRFRLNKMESLHRQRWSIVEWSSYQTRIQVSHKTRWTTTTQRPQTHTNNRRSHPEITGPGLYQRLLPPWSTSTHASCTQWPSTWAFTSQKLHKRDIAIYRHVCAVCAVCYVRVKVRYVWADLEPEKSNGRTVVRRVPVK